MILGTTYSHREISYLQLDHKDAFQELLDLQFDIIRLGCYWDEIQPQKNTWDFSRIKEQLDQCEKAQQNVLLTLGMKAPRWPEYYIPSWLEGRDVSSLFPEVSEFLTRCIEELKKYTCITHWQVENEPLGPSGPNNFSIPIDLLEREVKLVKSIDPRPLVLNAWMDYIEKDHLVATLTPFADIIGFDIYYKTPKNRFFYTGPKSSQTYFASAIKQSSKPVWIVELQAEPWETSQEKKFSKNPRSISTSILKDNYEKALTLSPQAILFWGYEYWYLRKTQGDTRYLEYIRSLLLKNT